MPEKILNDSWADYDNRKKKREDRLYFSCEEEWEVDYLVLKIKKIYPSKSEFAIRAAIASCCMIVKPPRPRDTFVRCVMGKL